MLFSSNIPVKIDISPENEDELLDTIYREMRRISIHCKQDDDCIIAESINASFGSILRNDKTTITLHASRRGTGYNIEAETTYSPSGWFWIFLVLDFVLVVTVVGFIIGLAFTLGLYFHNKNLVSSGIDRALQNAERAVK